LQNNVLVVIYVTLIVIGPEIS